MWRVLRQTILGKWHNVRQVPSATANQADAKEAKFPCFGATLNCLRSLGIQPDGHYDFRHHHQGSTHQQWEKCPKFKPCLVDTISWLGTSFILGMRLQRYFISRKEKDSPSQSRTLKLKQRLQDAIDFISPDLTGSLHALPRKALAEASLESTTVEESLQQVEQVVSSFAGLLENQLGVDAASRSKESAAFAHFHQAATSLGCPRAHYNLGVCYETGRGTAADLTLAVQHYLVAAKKGHASALYNLGMFYLEGLGGLQCSESRGLACIQKAADKLLPEALLYMGVYFHERNKSVRAIQYFSQAAQQDNVEAQFYLGLCHHHGWGVNINPAQARHYFALASSGGHADAARWLAFHQRSRPIHISFSASDLKSQDCAGAGKQNVPSAYLNIMALNPALCAAH